MHSGDNAVVCPAMKHLLVYTGAGRPMVYGRLADTRHLTDRRNLMTAV